MAASAASVTCFMGMAKMQPITIPIEITEPTRAPVSYLSASGTVPGAQIAHRVEKYPLEIPKTSALVIINQSESKTPLVAKIIGIKVAKKISLEKLPIKIPFLESIAHYLPPIVLPTVSPMLNRSSMNRSNQLDSLSLMFFYINARFVSSITPGKKTKVNAKMKIIAVKYPSVILSCLYTALQKSPIDLISIGFNSFLVSPSDASVGTSSPRVEPLYST